MTKQTHQDSGLILAEWEAFYRDLDINCDLFGVRIPDDPGGFERVIIMAPGVTPQVAFDFCKRHFSCWKWTRRNLDEIVTSERTTKNTPYAVRFRNRVEADEELENLSYNQLKQQGIIGITLAERLIYEYKYYTETNKHLDIHHWTLCASSCYTDGHLHVHWRSYSDELLVNWDGPGDARELLRSRSAVL